MPLFSAKSSSYREFSDRLSRGFSGGAAASFSPGKDGELKDKPSEMAPTAVKMVTGDAASVRESAWNLKSVSSESCSISDSRSSKISVYVTDSGSTRGSSNGCFGAFISVHSSGSGFCLLHVFGGKQAEDKRHVVPHVKLRDALRYALADVVEVWGFSPNHTA